MGVHREGVYQGVYTRVDTSYYATYPPWVYLPPSLLYLPTHPGYTTTLPCSAVLHHGYVRVCCVSEKRPWALFPGELERMRSIEPSSLPGCEECYTFLRINLCSFREQRWDRSDSDRVNHGKTPYERHLSAEFSHLPAIQSLGDCSPCGAFYLPPLCKNVQDVPVCGPVAGVLSRCGSCCADCYPVLTTVDSRS